MMGTGYLDVDSAPSEVLLSMGTVKLAVDSAAPYHRYFYWRHSLDSMKPKHYRDGVFEDPWSMKDKICETKFFTSSNQMKSQIWNLTDTNWLDPILYRSKLMYLESGDTVMNYCTTWFWLSTSLTSAHFINKPILVESSFNFTKSSRPVFKLSATTRNRKCNR